MEEWLLRNELSRKRILIILLPCAIISHAWLTISSGLVGRIFGIEFALPTKGIPITNWDFAPQLFVLAFEEEMLFRIMLPTLLFFQTSMRWKNVLLAGISTSLLFGLAHGHIACIFMQGVVGFFWYCIFLRCGGLDAIRAITHPKDRMDKIILPKCAKAVLTVSAVHFLTNGITALEYLYRGGKFF